MGAREPLVSEDMMAEPSSLGPENTLLQALETMRLSGDLAHALVDGLRGAERA
jgi:hypothetical protein